MKGTWSGMQIQWEGRLRAGISGHRPDGTRKPAKETDRTRPGDQRKKQAGTIAVPTSSGPPGHRRGCRPVLAENRPAGLFSGCRGPPEGKAFGSLPACFPGAAPPTGRLSSGPPSGENCPPDSFPGPHNPIRERLPASPSLPDTSQRPVFRALRTAQSLPPWGRCRATGATDEELWMNSRHSIG